MTAPLTVTVGGAAVAIAADQVAQIAADAKRGAGVQMLFACDACSAVCYSYVSAAGTVARRCPCCRERERLLTDDPTRLRTATIGTHRRLDLRAAMRTITRRSAA